MIEGAAILAAGALSGWLLRSGWYRARSPRPVKNRCECKHPWALHDEAGVCSGSERVATRWNSYGDPIAYGDKPCPCKRYCGPVPVEAYGYQQLGGGA